MDAVPGMMNSPLGKQADLLSLEASRGANNAKSRIGTMLNGNNEKASASFMSVKGSQRVLFECLPLSAMPDLEYDWSAPPFPVMVESAREWLLSS